MRQVFFGRNDELERLESFLSKKEAGFLMVRGRRRIGKSWLLTEFGKKVGAFYFLGEQDRSSRDLMRKMAQDWQSFSGDDSVAIIRVSDLSWKRLFVAMANYCRQRPEKSHLFIFDEIQWIAKRKSGFVGQLKEAWVELEKLGNVKIIICGSSQRFFTQKTASETSVLHRMRTVADLWVRPFSLGEIRQHYFPKWSEEQICLVFMMTGGVPYYLERIPRSGNFIRCLNEAFFVRDSIFLDEFREVLNLEFTKESSTTAEKLMASLGQVGSTLEGMREKSGIQSESTVRSMVEQLLEFGLVAEKRCAGTQKGNRRGSRFYLKDPFLNFYFQILRPLAPKVRKNTKTNLFAGVLSSKQGYYIENFSGKAFELLTEWVLEQKLSSSGQEPILEKLALADEEFAVGHYWENGKTQVDLLIEQGEDRETRILELKWISKKAGVKSGYLDEVKGKKYSPPKGWSVSHHLLLSQAATEPFQKMAAEEEVQILGLEDLF